MNFSLRPLPLPFRRSYSVIDISTNSSFKQLAWNCGETERRTCQIYPYTISTGPEPASESIRHSARTVHQARIPRSTLPSTIFNCTALTHESNVDCNKNNCSRQFFVGETGYSGQVTGLMVVAWKEWDRKSEVPSPP